MLQEIKLEGLEENPFNLFGHWAIAAAGDELSCNGMTVGWGTLGVLWNRNVATVYIRPQRYTREFFDREDNFSLCFFSDDYKKALLTFGRYSGRDMDKTAAASLHAEHENGCPRFEEARLVLECRKIYRDTLKPENFVDKSIDEHYPDKDYHVFYVGEIERVLVSRD